MLAALQNISAPSPTTYQERYEPDRFTIEYKEETNTFILKGEFDSEKSYQSLRDAHKLIQQHMNSRSEINLYLYIKTADLKAINLLNQISGQCKDFTGKTHVTWFVSSTQPSQYAMAYEMTCRYDLNTTIVDVI